MEVKKGFERGVVSDYTMGVQDFERYDDILKAINQAFESVYSGNTSSIYSLIGNLNTLFIEWSPIMLPSVREELKQMLADLMIKINNINFTAYNGRSIDLVKENSFRDAMDKIIDVRLKLMQERQRAGFGIKTSNVQTQRQILHRALEL